MHKVIKELSTGSFVIEIKTKLFEGYRLATQEDLNSGKTLNLFMEENWKEIEGRRGS
jgi:hypothetical protein